MSLKKFTVAPGAIDSNKGDQALVASCIQMIRSMYPDAQIGVIGTSQSEIENQNGEMRHTKKLDVQGFCPLLSSPRRGKIQRSGASDVFSVRLLMTLNSVLDFFRSMLFLFISPYPRVSRIFLNKQKRESYDFIRTSDYMFVKGGGFIYADKGARYYYYIYFQLYSIMLAHRLKVPVIIMPNSFGPFESAVSRRLSRSVLNKCRLIATRERISDKRLEEIGVNNSIIRSLPDMAFMTDSIDSQDAMNLLTRFGVKPEDKKVGITVRPWRFLGHRNPSQAWDDYITAIAELVKYVVAKGYKPVFFPQSIGPHDHEDDRIAIRALCEKLNEVSYSFADGDWLPAELVGMYSRMDYFIGTRMHSVIFSMLGDVPSIAISYQGPKARGIMEEAGLGDYVIDIEDVTAEKLKRTFNGLVENTDEAKVRISESVKSFKAELENWKQTVEEVCSK